MSQSSAPPRRVPTELLALFALWVLMHIPALFSHQPWHFDELRYLEVARQLGEYGNWLVPHING
jgi:4-amino-4-deoxy-L-arabinose transferase-like glycosyltransferase